MLTCHFFFFSLFFWFFPYDNYGSGLNSDKCYCTELISHSSVSLSLTYFQSSQPIKIINYFVTQSKFIAITALYCFKFHSFYFRNQNAPYYLLNRNIFVRPILSRKCFVLFLLIFSGDIQLNPGPVSLKSQYVSSPLDVYEPFLSPTVPKLRLATLNSRSVVNKSAVINNHILENKINILCNTETWINDGEFSNSLLSALIPSNYVLSQYYVRPRPFRGGGVAIINHKSVHHTHVSTSVFFTFKCEGSVITSSNSSFKLFAVYRPPSSSMSTFFTEFESLLEFHISANIDIHIDDLNDVNSSHFLKLLNTFNLC